MEIKVKLFATFREGRFAVEQMEFPEGATVLDVAKKIKIEPKEVSIAMINGFSSELDSVLNEGDTLVLFPPVGGG
ncbi:MAG: molybdopterin synthase sulfur carrier subunit [Desulfitibacter sp. BRH_c19]|nr:MAG: molybdopterin synthase sulfur carrier subunit [Desulfitibacter sp. BRH_c19]